MIYISEYRTMGRGQDGTTVPGGAEPALTVQTVVEGASEPFGEATHFVRVVSDADCLITFGDSKPTLLPAGYPEYFGVSKGGKLTVVEV